MCPSLYQDKMAGQRVATLCPLVLTIALPALERGLDKYIVDDDR